jgi:hypothetical protein
LKDIAYRRAVPVYYDEKERNYRLDIQVFENMLKSDTEKGLIPFWYGATYGTTFSAANDLTP